MFVVEEGGLKQLVFVMVGYVTFAITLLKRLFALVYRFWKEMDVQAVKSTIQNNKQIAIRSLGGFAGLYVYYSFLVYIHELLHAGLIVFIITLLVLLYTIGLGDNTGANSGIPSAYSVFNRGMHRILGTVDAEELARQYAGGVMAARAGGGGGGMGRNNDFNDEGAWVQEDVEEEDEQDVVQERRRRRRLERLQRRNDNDDILVAENLQDTDDEHANNNGNVVNGEDDLEEEAQENLPLNNRENVAAARKSGKKARRRNLELRREMQRQRQAAVALGFGAGDVVGDGNNAMLREMEAIDGLVE